MCLIHATCVFLKHVASWKTKEPSGIMLSMVVEDNPLGGYSIYFFRITYTFYSFNGSSSAGSK
jgi:hypothetical protein